MVTLYIYRHFKNYIDESVNKAANHLQQNLGGGLKHDFPGSNFDHR